MNTYINIDTEKVVATIVAALTPKGSTVSTQLSKSMERSRQLISKHIQNLCTLPVCDD